MASAEFTIVPVAGHASEPGILKALVAATDRLRSRRTPQAVE